MTINPVRLRHLHKALAPILVLPLLLTVITASLYQFAHLNGNAKYVGWLMSLHRGKFGPLNLEMIYPFLNALGLLTMAITGIWMWWWQRPTRRS